jgi:CYTH domain-containing protein
MGSAAFLTVKGRREGIGRAEFEYPIPAEDAAYMLDVLCQQALVEKTRYCVPVAGLTWEVDVFTGANAGLVIAEVELERADQAVELPAWAGQEVSTDYRYTNAYLAQHPYRSWEVSHEDRHRQ